MRRLMVWVTLWLISGGITLVGGHNCCPLPIRVPFGHVIVFGNKKLVDHQNVSRHCKINQVASK
jgi:hypothetical protein